MTESEAWDRWQNQQDEEARGWLIEYHDPIAQRAAATIKGARSQDRPDLLQAARCGLVKAVDIWRPDSGMNFLRFALLKCKYAAVDQIREVAFVPKSIRNPARKLEAVEAELTVKLAGRPPSEAELADYMGIDPDALAALRSQLKGTQWTVGSLSEAGQGGETSDGAGLAGQAERLRDPQALEPEQEYLRAEQAAVLAGIVARLPPSYRHVLREKLWGGRSQKSLAAELGTHESRVSQLFHHGLSRCRELAHQRILPELAAR